jgi:tetratricopeptide (TPR) repeat protein/tRNA A-37 threonylcarbamoyl transferase component Bud32
LIEPSDSGDDDFDDDLDDPLLQSVAAAPPIALGETRVLPGTVIAQSYRIEREIGSGGMGVVYEAHDLVLSRRIALKLHEIGTSERAARIWREARAMARLTHPNVVAVHEVGVEASRGYIAMELVDGTNARTWVAIAKRSWEEIVEVYRQAGRGLAAAHDAGLVHRDFKPDNVLVGADGRVRVADFGLALDPGTIPPTTRAEELHAGRVTLTGATVGTPGYMAPEQLRGEPVDARSDQYALCVALFESLYGVRPDAKDEDEDTREVPAWIRVALERGLAIDPARRHHDVHALVAALDPAPHRRRRARRLTIVLGVVAGAMLLGAGRWAADTKDSPCVDAAAPLDATWSPERLDALRLAFADRSASLRDATLAVLEPGFDRFATQWRDAAREACEATHVHGQQSASRLDARTDCLDRARTRFEAAIALYDAADVDAMVAAETVVARLPDVAMCDRVDAAIATDEVRPEREAAHGQLRAMLDRAAAEVAASRLEQAKATLDELVPSLEREGFTHSLAEARRLRGEVALNMGRRTEAVDELAAALVLGSSGTDRDAIATAQLALANAVGRVGTGRDEALRLLASARAIAEDLAWSATRRLDLDVAEFEIAFHAERYDELERVGTRLLDDDELDDHRRVRVMSLLATRLERQSRFAEALVAHDRVLAYVERLRGPDHPQVAMALGNRAHTLQRLSRFDEATQSLERALAIRIASFGADAPTVGEIYRQLGDTAQDHAIAIAHYERALAIHRAAGDDVGSILALANLSHRREISGDLESARARLDEALPLAERTYGKDSLQVGRLLVNRGSLLYAAGEHAQGTAELERALAVLVAQLPEGDVATATARLSLSLFRAAAGRHDEALALYDAGDKAILAAFPDDHPRRVAMMFQRARLLDSIDRPEAATLQWQATVEYAEQHLAPDDALLLEVWMPWAERLLEKGERAAAQDVLGRAQALDARLADDPERTATLSTLASAARG